MNRLSGWAAAGLVAVGAIVMLPSTQVFAAGSADLSVRQRFSGGSSSGATLDTVRIHNAGRVTANHVNLSLFIKTSSSVLGIHSSSGTCELEPAPPGLSLFMATCQLPSIATGKTGLDKITWSGGVGLAFTATVTVGTSTEDSNISNNISTASSWFGPRSDLRLTQTAKSGPSSGKAKVVSTIVNHGPNNANALQLTMEINSPGYRGVLASSNVSASCQFIPPASGYNRAVACTTNGLATRAKWVVTFSFSGTAGDTLQVTNQVSANNPTDPVTTNNSASSSTKYHS